MPGRKGTEFSFSRQLHQDKNCQYCQKPFNCGSEYWKIYCSSECNHDAYIFRKKGVRPIRRNQINTIAEKLLSGKSLTDYTLCKSFICNDLQQKTEIKNEVYHTLSFWSINSFFFLISTFLVRFLIKLISPVSNALLRANRFLVERGAA